MNDNQIIKLFFTRNEDAIQQTAHKYGTRLTGLAANIVRNNEDAQECVNDTYLKACIGWREDGTDALEAFAVTSFKLRKFSSSLQWDLIPDYHGTKDFGSSADFYGWSDQSGYHSACVVMKDGSEVTLPIRNKVVDLDQVDYVLLPDGTKLPATNTR